MFVLLAEYANRPMRAGSGEAEALGMAYPHVLHLLLALQSPPVVSDAWYGITLAGHPAGTYHETVSRRDGGGFRTLDDMSLSIGRLGSAVRLVTHVVTDEDGSGNFIECQSTTRYSKTAMRSTATRRGADIELTGEAGGKTYARHVPAPPVLLGPQAVASRLASSSASRGKAAFSVFDGLASRCATETFTRTGARSAEDRVDSEPGFSVVVYDDRGRMLRREQAMPFGALVMVRITASQAKVYALGGQMPRDLFERTLVRSNVRLPDPRAIEGVRLLLTTDRPDLGWPDLASQSQTVVSKSPSRIVLDVTRSVDAPAGQEAPLVEALEPNALIQSDDPAVAALARRCAGTAPVLAARDWLATHARLDPGVALAPASETIHTHGGTCLAFAILLAALERAEGVPSRVVEGFVYEQGIWGGHAWTEVWQDGRWIAYDAALPSRRSADAARFGFARSTLAAGPEDLLDGGIQLYGHLHIRVLEYVLRGRHFRVGARRRPMPAGDVYTDKTLGLTVRKPRRARFTETDCVYPDATVVAIRFPDAVVRVQERSAGVSAVPSNRRTVSVQGRTVEMSWEHDGSLWSLKATGPHARQDLAWTLAHMQLQ